MAWVKLDDQFSEHPKIMQAGPLAAWLYVCGLTYVARQLTDGFIPESKVRSLADISNWRQLADRLVKIGLWEKVDDGFQVHDYLDYNPSRQQVLANREATKQRVSNWRSNHVGNGVTSDVTDTVRNGVSNTVPVPVPGPVPGDSLGKNFKEI